MRDKQTGVYRHRQTDRQTDRVRDGQTGMQAQRDGWERLTDLFLTSQ